jgi:hypothetical protein
LRESAETGEPVDLAPGEDIDPGDAEASWGPERRIPITALREVLTSGDLRVDPRGLRIRGAWFQEPLDLAYVAFPHPLHLVACVLDSLNAKNSRFLELSLRSTHCLRGIDLSQSEITGSVYANGFRADGGIHGWVAKIGGQLLLGVCS